MNQRFGLPKRYKVISLQQAAIDVLKASEGSPRAIPSGGLAATLRRKSAARVAMAGGGHRGSRRRYGQRSTRSTLRRNLCKNDSLLAHMETHGHGRVDNWRTIHCVSGQDPMYARRVHRATIEGDYGLGRFESERAKRFSVET